MTFNGSTSKSYSYDAMSRLTGITNNLSGTSMDQTLSFTRSPSGQIATQTNSNTAYDPIASTYDVDSIINALNQITSQTGTATFTYDTAGNLTSGAGNTYGYDYANRLTSTSGTGGAGTLTYDPASRLRTLTSGGVVTSFLYDGQNIIAEYEGGVLVKRYVHGPSSDEPLVEYTGSGTSSKVWLISDSRGAITGHVNGSGTSVATNSYDSYGVPGASNTGRFQYTGQMYLEEIGLYYYKARFYSADLKRFLQTDPIGYGDGLNMYAYVGGDPMNFTDPSGLTQCERYSVNDDCDEGMDEVISRGVRQLRDEERVTYYGGSPVFGGALFANFVVYGVRIGVGQLQPSYEDINTVHEAKCIPYQSSHFPTDNILSNEPLDSKARGFLGTGPRLNGPYSTFNNALGNFRSNFTQSRTSAQVYPNTGGSIFIGDNGFYVSSLGSTINGANSGGSRTGNNAGLWSGLEFVAGIAVTSDSAGGNSFRRPPGSPFVLLIVGNRNPNTGANEVDDKTCY